MTEKKFKVSSQYAYHVENPYKTQRWWHDKNGVLCGMSVEQYWEECAKPKNRFTPTMFEALAPKLCIGAAFLLICAIIGLR